MAIGLWFFLMKFVHKKCNEVSVKNNGDDNDSGDGSGNDNGWWRKIK